MPLPTAAWHEQLPLKAAILPTTRRTAFDRLEAEREAPAVAGVRRCEQPPGGDDGGATREEEQQRRRGSLCRTPVGTAGRSGLEG